MLPPLTGIDPSLKRFSPEAVARALSFLPTEGHAVRRWWPEITLLHEQARAGTVGEFLEPGG